MVERAEQMQLHLAKLVQASGGDKEQAKALLPENMDIIDSELDIEAHTRSLLAVARDLDTFLQGLLNPEKHPITKLKDECKRLEEELKEKDVLLVKNMELLKRCKSTWTTEVEQQRKKLYPN